MRRGTSPITGRVGRAVAGIVAAIATFHAAAAALFIGAILATGCFITCDDPNPLIAIPILAAAVALAALGLAALWWGFVNRHWQRAWRTLALLSSTAFAALLFLVATRY